jgi:signal transduction histidine kinase
VAAPLEKLRWFKTLLGLDDDSITMLLPHRQVFTDAKDKFADAFFDYLHRIAETRIYLDHQRRSGYLQEAWARWLTSLFTADFSDNFLTYQWRSGLRHVEVGIDHRFITLGYSFLRQFCQEIIKAGVTGGDREILFQTVDKMVDLCLLVETQAFIEATSQCDIEVVRGISHQVRNPLTVIGGNIARLKRKAAPNDPAHALFDALILENKRLEAMVNDAAVYSEMFEKEAAFSRISLQELIPKVLAVLRERSAADDVEIILGLDPDASDVHADKDDMEIMFLHLLQNSFEAVDRARPLIRISSKRRSEEPTFIDVEIFNTGHAPSSEEIASLFVPFSSTKPHGTGFGLSIARLAARKSLGDIFLEALPGEGTRSVVKLPAFVKGG